ncbi:TetR/AcrR family transcriptional regulator [Rhodopseudomonas sp. BR0M22]|uniref:TetR/AcrR family transcriptional regulator n=1 Tax=Rhodopseudomonas sp. BR0M22 TaxID=2269369 RepID=UPI0013DE9377|nr:TetR/AcrR family transcriptional regulator [Rhodopseudomonas sp. BR0M22]NEW91195.1 TetR/AcrR family transcriptional regulator [Rhodopseudomonas sp. BR0M22]
MTDRIADLDTLDAKPRRRPRRNADQNRAAILKAATAEFATHGYAGARITRIVTKAGSNPRMIYELFGSKSELYVATLESALGALRTEELTLDLMHLDPLDGLLKLLDFMSGHFERNSHLVSLLRSENMMKARHMKKSARIQQMSSPVLGMTTRLLARGVAEGRLASDIDPLRLYVMIAALSQFHCANVHTLSSMFETDLSKSEWRAQRRDDARKMLAAYLTRGRDEVGKS